MEHRFILPLAMLIVNNPGTDNNTLGGVDGRIGDRGGVKLT